MKHAAQNLPLLQLCMCSDLGFAQLSGHVIKTYVSCAESSVLTYLQNCLMYPKYKKPSFDNAFYDREIKYTRK